MTYKPLPTRNGIVHPITVLSTPPVPRRDWELTQHDDGRWHVMRQGKRYAYGNLQACVQFIDRNSPNHIPTGDTYS